MTDPRNVAHDKRVLQEKVHHGVDLTTGTLHMPRPGKKPRVDPAQDGHGPDFDEPIDKTESGGEP